MSLLRALCLMALMAEEDVREMNTLVSVGFSLPLEQLADQQEGYGDNEN